MMLTGSQQRTRPAILHTERIYRQFSYTHSQGRPCLQHLVILMSKQVPVSLVVAQARGFSI